MLCKKCGAEQPDGTERCIFCGAALSEEVSQENNPASEENTVYDENERKRREQIEKMMAEKKQQLSEIEERRNSKKQKQKRNRIILICLIAAAVAAGSGIGAYYIKGAIDRQNSAVTPSPAPTAAMATEAPAETESPAPTETPLPEDAANVQSDVNTSNSGSTQSWTATGNTGSGTASSSTSSGASSAERASSSETVGSVSGSSGSSSGSPSSSSTPSKTGISTKKVESKLAKGGEVLYNQSTGRYLMTFVADNILYYANVSAGSTTDQINGKYMTINASPTGETYDGNTVYEISSVTRYDAEGYIIKDSGTRILTESDIAGFSKSKLALARNEIYARHGREFKVAAYRDYFNKCPWYSINPNYNYADDNSNLNSVEIKNVFLILKAETGR